LNGKRRAAVCLSYLAGGLAAVAALLVVVAVSTNSPPLPCAETPAAIALLPAGHISGFSHLAWDRERDYRPQWYISFDDLTTQNGSAGIFRTGVSRAARIHGLHLAIYDYTDEAAGAGRSHPWETQQGRMDLVCLIRASGPQTTWSKALRNQIKSANVTEALITGFSCEFFRDGASVLAISAIRAEASTRSGGLLLQGCVRVATGEGTVLEANRAIWEVRGGRFIVKGPCAVTRAGEKQPARDLIFNITPNVIETRPDRQEAGKGV
jgi:hypothetical protein